MSPSMKDNESEKPDHQPTNIGLDETLSAAPRTRRVSLKGYITANAETLRKHRDDGVDWSDIVTGIEKDLQVPVESKTVQVYLSRSYPAKKAREIERSKKAELDSDNKSLSVRDAENRRTRPDRNGECLDEDRRENPPDLIRPISFPGVGVNPFIAKRAPKDGEAS